ncbi:hypothetical protein CCACVL1_06339 [Corchorus capsularis]|uniref:Uncharacterized protein n=1 Tax=Corchorus capsularis TaxID=210143 RepID=A0A1R3JGA1_COCAP|nr:hypothetical protein CCACVL1_06339 [Corchorus capsularis]
MAKEAERSTTYEFFLLEFPSSTSIKFLITTSVAVFKNSDQSLVTTKTNFISLE